MTVQGYSSGDEIRDAVLEAVEQLQRDLGRPPTPSEVMAATSLKRPTLQYHMEHLEKAGQVRRIYGGRGIERVHPEVQS